MTFLEQQLQELQIKKSKVEYFKTLLGLLGGATIDNPIVQKANEEAALEVEAFLNKRIVSIEEGSGDMLEDSTDPSSNQFTKEEVEVLKITAQRLLKKGPEEVKPQAAAPVRRNPQPKGAFDDDDSQEELPRAQNPSSKNTRVANTDKISFAMSHRHLDQKRCSVVSKNGNEIQGKVVGTDAPYLVIALDTGHTVNVPPEEVTIG